MFIHIDHEKPLEKWTLRQKIMNFMIYLRLTKDKNKVLLLQYQNMQATATKIE